MEVVDGGGAVKKGSGRERAERGKEEREAVER